MPKSQVAVDTLPTLKLTLTQMHLELLLSNQVDQQTLRGVAHALTNVCYARSNRLMHQLIHHRSQLTDIDEAQVQADAWERLGRLLTDITREARKRML